MSTLKAGLTFERNEYGYPVIKSADRKTAHRHFMPDSDLRSSVAAMMAHRVSGAIIGLMFVFGVIGWAWTFLISG